MNTNIAEQNTRRTECIREISNELDRARWYLIGKEFESIGSPNANATTLQVGHELASLPIPQDVAANGGDILGIKFKACPPAPTGDN